MNKGQYISNEKKAIHMWVKYNKGKATKCVDCGTTKNVGWANVNHKYERKLFHYVERCNKCHKIFDINHNNYQMKNLFKKGFDKRRISTQFRNGHPYRRQK